DWVMHDRQRAPLLEVAGTRGARRAQQLPYARIRRAPAPVVAVEAAALVLALEAFGHQRVHDRRRRDAARLGDGLAGVAGDLEADLVDELQRTDRPPELGHGTVDR